MTRRDWGKAALGGLVAAAGSAGAPAPAQPRDAYDYLHLDVFTDRPLTGNQLAVFLEPRGLDAATMQTFAKEFNFSEITFVFPREDEATDVRVRIFGPGRELPFAGHPVVGTAFALAHAGRVQPGRRRMMFGLGAGPTPVDLEWRDGRLAFAWMTQQRPTFGPTIPDLDALAQALNVEPAALRATGTPVQEVSCGSPFFFVPLATRQAVDAVTVDRRAMEEIYQRHDAQRRSVFVFSPERGADGATVYSRMLGLGGTEDAATGAASGPLGCYLVRHGLVPPASADRIVSAQGVKMGRPSRIHIRIGAEGSEITNVQVGGESVVVGSGVLRTTADRGARP